LIICPACGSTVEGQLSVGCPSCGARAVGPPLAKPEHQLRSYGPAVITALTGLVMLSAFLSSVVAGWIVKGASLQFGAIVQAGQVSAWQVKWFALPVAIAAIWGGARLTRQIGRTPERFAGLRLARTGFSAAIVTTLMIGTLIGVTVPERLRRRQWGFEAAEQARGYTLHRALQQYRDLHGTLPPQEDLVKELRKLSDPNGSIADALQFVDANGYQPGAVLAAAAPKSKTLERGGAIRNASLTTTVDPPTVSFTNYELRLPGADKKLNTDDDLIVRDGLLLTVAGLRDYTSISKTP
jgi:type II secretory pathway pseudopilin PulG